MTAMAEALRAAGLTKAGNDGEELITTQQLSREIHTHEKTIIRWRTAGEGPPYVRIGRGRVLYRRRDVAAWLAARTHQPHPEKKRIGSA